MDRKQWIDECAERFSWAGCSAFSARDCAIAEFNIWCRDEPIDNSPELPNDRWPAPIEAADDSMREWENDDADA